MSDLSKDFNTVIAAAFKPPLKRAGFRKSALCFNRDHGTCHHVIQIQKSQGNSAASLRFYINIGVGLPVVWALEGRSFPAPIKPHFCHVSCRVDDIVPDAAKIFELSLDRDPAALTAELSRIIEATLTELAPLDSPEALLDGPLSFHNTVRAQILYCLERDAEAIEALKAHARDFADRKNSSVEDLIERLNLPRLG